MATKIRAKISERNEFYISKHRYYELKHFCMQYPEWKKELKDLDGYGNRSSGAIDGMPHRKGDESPTEVYGELRLYLSGKIEMVEEAARKTAGDFWKLMVKAVTEEISYECLNARENVPFGKDLWYEMYRKFFYILSLSRK